MRSRFAETNATSKKQAIMKEREEPLSAGYAPKIFEDRFAGCRHLLHFVAVRILGSQDEGEHAVRNCRVAASRNPPSFESDGAFRSWIVRILIHEALALVRQRNVS